MAFLILSDLHFGHASSHDDLRLSSATGDTDVILAGSIRERLVKTCENNSTFDIHSLLVSGDLTSTAAPSEFVECVNVVQEVAGRLGVDESNVVFSLGNHDVNWRVSGLSKAKDRGKEYPEDHRYAELAGHSAAPFVPQNLSIRSGPLPQCGVARMKDCCVVVLNSGFFCVDEQEYPHGKLGPEQLEWLSGAFDDLGSPDMWRILLLHHHPQKYSYPTLTPDVSMVEEGSELLDAVGRIGVDLVIHGHRHHPMLFTDTRNGWDRPVTFLSAGSVGVAPKWRATGVIPNTFHVVRLEDRGPDGAAIGTVFTFQYGAKGWEPATSSSIPMDAVQRFGAIADRISLEGLASSVIESALVSPGLLLPRFSQLPVALQCMRHADLNELIRFLAGLRGAKFYGSYPSDDPEPMLVRRP